jgi:hypothetical protein
MHVYTVYKYLKDWELTPFSFLRGAAFAGGSLRGRPPKDLQYISMVLQPHTKCMTEHVSKRILRTCGRVDIFILSPPPPRTRPARARSAAARRRRFHQHGRRPPPPPGALHGALHSALGGGRAYGSGGGGRIDTAVMVARGLAAVQPKAGQEESGETERGAEAEAWSVHTER